MSNKDIIRNRLKINESISNAKVFKNIQEEYVSFYNYLCLFSKELIIYECDKVSNFLSDSIALDLKRRGVKFFWNYYMLFISSGNWCYKFIWKMIFFE